MVDIYPFRHGGVTQSTYFDTLTAVREAALRYDKPYWLYVQAFSDDDRRVPSESDMRMQVYSALACGYTGFSYFTYDGYDNSIVTIDGVPTQVFPRVFVVNSEVSRLGQALRFMRSTDVRFIPGRAGNPTPAGLTNWSAGAGADPHILSIDIDGDAAGEDGMIGFFTDDRGNRFFMLVNLHHGAGESPAGTSLNFHVEFDAAVTELLRLSRETGEEEVVYLNDHALDIVLPGGTGELFGYWHFPLSGPGDANLDGIVDDDDLSLLLANWTGVGGEGKTWAQGDFTGNGAVSDSDLSLLLANWTGRAPVAAIPEPAGLSLLAVATLILRTRRLRTAW
jgi:hypothetical protein